MFLGNDLTTPNFWMYSFRAKKVMMLSDPKHLDYILPFMQPEGYFQFRGEGARMISIEYDR